MNDDPAPLRALIVDDEAMAVERLQLLLSRIDNVSCAGTAADGESALSLIESTPADVVILDISMPGLTGVDVAETLSAREDAPAVIFATAYDEHAVRAFELAAVDYLLKPVGIDRLTLALDRARCAVRTAPRPSRYATEFWVPHRAEMLRLDVRDIDHIEAERDYMRLHVGERSYLLHQTAKHLEERLDPDAFIRTHRSHIFRRAAIARIVHEGMGIWFIETRSGSRHRIGRTYLRSVKALFRQ